MLELGAIELKEMQIECFMQDILYESLFLSVQSMTDKVAPQL